MKIAVEGLGKMGTQIVKRLVDNGHSVIAVVRREASAQEARAIGATAVLTKQDAVAEFGNEHIKVWLMIPAGAVDAEIDNWLEVLPSGSLLIDGGNSDFRGTIKHSELAESKDVRFVDIGVSGGVMGQKNGFSMMAGGHEESYNQIKPVLDALSPPRGGHEFFGPAGSGHYVKMVHNAIEYGMMESLAEGYRVLKEGHYPNIDLAKAGSIWQRASVIESTLNNLAFEVAREDTNLSDIEGVVAESGEARWTLEIAKEKGIDMPAIESAFDVRLRSQKGEVNYATKMLAALRNKFGGHSLSGK